MVDGVNACEPAGAKDEAIAAIGVASFEHPQARSRVEWALRIADILDQYLQDSLTDPRPIETWLEPQPQRQDSLTDQLTDLHLVAARLGMYDAADWLWKRMHHG